jgi:MFS family permease
VIRRLGGVEGVYDPRLPMANQTSNPASIPLVLLITFLGSMGTAVVTTGIAFIADQGLGYSGTQNLLLALALGGSYIPAAYFSGPVINRAIKRSAMFTTKRVLVGLMLLLTLVAQLPYLASTFFPAQTEIALWVMGIVFMATTGVQWPIVHAYLSGGRSGKLMRSTIGKFNITWATALVLSFWSMAPLLESSPFLIVSLLGGIHLIIAGLVLLLSAEPAKHIEETHERHPPVYIPLLMVFRMMLIASYVILSVMTPLLPSIETKLGLPELWWTPVASTWLVVRIFFFALFERWHGWHGRWSVPWIGMGALIVGFAIAMIAPTVGSVNSDGLNSTGLTLLIVGLSIAGIGIATTYYGALYYAMAVGNADVDAGGKHEAFIGVGYTAGPLCGLVGGLLADGPGGVIAVTSVVVLLMVGFAVKGARKNRAKS